MTKSLLIVLSKKIEYAIEQHPSFLKVLSEKELIDLEKSNKQREW